MARAPAFYRLLGPGLPPEADGHVEVTLPGARRHGRRPVRPAQLSRAGPDEGADLLGEVRLAGVASRARRPAPRLIARPPHRATRAARQGGIAGQPRGEVEQHRGGIVAALDAGGRGAGEIGEQLGERDALVAQRRAGHATSDGSAPGWKRTPAAAPERDRRSGAVSGPATRSSPLLQTRSVHPSGSTRREVRRASRRPRSPPAVPSAASFPVRARPRDRCSPAREWPALTSRATHLRSTASISRVMVTLSPITTPPPSSGIWMSTPKSLRLMVVVASNPARVPP
ncbi:hypothetical protein SAMN05443637_101187 [Pseudonocardia thermophila]|uniref:Uncharacterized protein n=1 Tax=Pseudonocardia thermophila TaxID=1848 RepID=A0A1M6ND88_PSETH|nr:hypothetical protein SAMN05443637_101187 [Pseudonocardia thermophila]